MRKRELRLMFWNAVIKTINVTMVFGVPPMVTFAVLVPYELTNETEGATSPYITPQTAFTMLSLFNVLRFPLVVLPKALRCVSEAVNSIHNLEKFMTEPAAPKHDTQGKTGVHFQKVRGRAARVAFWPAYARRRQQLYPALLCLRLCCHPGSRHVLAQNA